MEQIARIEAQLGSLLELGELVGALRSIAAARLHEAQDALVGTRSFCAIVERAISAIAPVATAAPDREVSTGQGARALVLITSQNGFVGGFNTRLADYALEVREPGEALLVVGRRGEAALAAHGIAADENHEMTGHVPGITRLARRISAGLTGLASVRIVHAHHGGAAEYAPVVRPVLPLPATILGPDRRDDPPLLQLAPDVLLGALSADYLFAEIAHALMDSLACENAARLRTMDAASRNIEDRLEKLRRAERVARQEEMTAEMIDIVTGAEAIFHGGA